MANTYGDIAQVRAIIFREDQQAVTLRSNQSTVYSASRDIQLPPGDAAHVIVSADSTQTLTNKTLTSPTITGGTLTALTGLAIRDTSAAFDVTLAATSSPVLSAGRTLTLNMNNAARTVSLSGNLTVGGTLITAAAFTVSGFDVELTATASTSVTLPTTGTLATRTGTETLTNKTITSSTNTVGVQDNKFTLYDDGDNTRIAAFQCSGITAGNTRTLTWPDFSGTIATLAGTESLSNKTLVTPVLGTPTSGTLTNCTGLPVSSGISGLGTNVATFLATPSSANLAAALTDETGSGANVFGTSPTISTPTINGVTDGSSAASSVVGEVLTIALAAASANGLATNVAENLTAGTLAVTAGEWEISGAVAFRGGVGTTVTALDVTLSTTSGTLPASTTLLSPDSAGQIWVECGLSGSALSDWDFTVNIPPYITRLTGSPSALYCVVKGIFGVSTLSAYGRIQARRVR